MPVSLAYDRVHTVVQLQKIDLCSALNLLQIATNLQTSVGSCKRCTPLIMTFSRSVHQHLCHITRTLLLSTSVQWYRTSHLHHSEAVADVILKVYSDLSRYLIIDWIHFIHVKSVGD